MVPLVSVPPLHTGGVVVVVVAGVVVAGVVVVPGVHTRLNEPRPRAVVSSGHGVTHLPPLRYRAFLHFSQSNAMRAPVSNMHA